MAVNEEQVILIGQLARGGCSDPDIAERMGLTTNQVRKARKDNDIPAGERRWLRSDRED